MSDTHKYMEANFITVTQVELSINRQEKTERPIPFLNTILLFVSGISIDPRGAV